MERNAEKELPWFSFSYYAKRVCCCDLMPYVINILATGSDLNHHLVRREAGKQSCNLACRMAPTVPQKIHNMKEFTDFLKNAGPNLVVVDFTAKWCGPCKMMRPFVYEMAVRYGNVLFCIVDVDVAEDVANNCNIVAMPTFQLFKKGEKIFEMTGANAKKLESKIKELM